MKYFDRTGKAWLLTIHIILAGLWVGVGLSMTIMVFFLTDTASGDELYAVHWAVKFLDDYLIIPSAMAMLLTGLLYGLKTKWGFFRYHWVTVKWIITVALVLLGTFFLGPWTNQLAALSDEYRKFAVSHPDYQSSKTFLLIFGTFQLVVLFVMIYISVVKPWGKRKTKSA